MRHMLKNTILIETRYFTKRSAYIKEEKNRKIKESMRRGYLEMKSINLDIASEAFQAEEEADTTLERSVSGV